MTNQDRSTVNDFLTGLDMLIGVGYRGGDQATFVSRPSVSLKTREHESHEWQVVRGIQKIASYRWAVRAGVC